MLAGCVKCQICIDDHWPMAIVINRGPTCLSHEDALVKDYWRVSWGQSANPRLPIKWLLKQPTQPSIPLG